jgi:hypothetical protein
MTTLGVPQRQDRTLEEDEALRILAAADHGVLAMVGAGGQPHALPLSHVLSGDVLYAQCAPLVNKLKNLAQEPRVSYCVVEDDTVESSILAAHYESAVALGPAEIVDDDGEKFRALQLLVKRSSGGTRAGNEAYVARMLPKTEVLRIRIEELTGEVHHNQAFAATKAVPF